MRRRKIAIGYLLMLFAGASAAKAHAFLDYTSPPVGSTVKEAPKWIKLQLSEGIEPLFSGAELFAETDKSIAATFIVEPTDNKVLLVTPQTPLMPGTYHLAWHVTSVDTHHTEGSFLFTIAPD
jgi:methionine-rich copper-binding protein CopC